MATIPTTSEIFELRFTGKINPEAVRLSELAEILQAFETSLVEVALREYDELEAQNVVLSLIDIEAKSLKLRFKPRLRDILFTAFLFVSESIATNNYGNLPMKTVESLQLINKFCRAKKCVAEWRDDPNAANPRAIITPESEISIPETAYLYGETTVYGKVQRVGGAEPKVSLKINEHHPTIYCSVSEELAKELGKNLYLEIGLKGTAKWYLPTLNIVEFKITDIVYLQTTSFTESVEHLSKLIGEYWNDVTDVEVEISKYRSGIAS